MPGAAQRKASRPSGKTVLIARIRRRQITAVLRDACGGPCTTDDAVTFLDEVLPHLRTASAPAAFDFVLGEWVRRHTPGLSEADVADACARILPNPPPCTSAAIGTRLGLTIEQYERLRLTHILPAGWTKAKHQKHLRAKKAAARKAERLASGETKRPHEQSVARLAPWKMAGLSRSAFYLLPVEQREHLTQQAREAQA